MGVLEKMTREMSEERSPQLVRDLMSVGVPTCPPSTPVDELVRLMLEKDFEAVVVLDGNQGHAIGFVSMDELIRAYTQTDYLDLTAENVMRDGLPTVPPDIPLKAAAQIMQDQSVRVLFLTHHAGGIEYPAAWLTYKHLLRHMGSRDESDLRDLGIKAERESPLDVFIRRRDEARRRFQSE